MSESFPTWRSAFFKVLFTEEKVLDFQINEDTWGRRNGWSASVSALRDIFLHRRHVIQFQLWCEYRQPLWGELASSMSHIRWLGLIIGAVSIHIRERRPFLLENLPNLTSLRMRDNEMEISVQKWWLSSISLRLPALETLEWLPGVITIEALKEINFECPNLKNLEMSM